jgi:hypothetical protein
MNCRHIQTKFPDFLTGDLDSKTVEAIHNHVALCTSCCQELEDLTTTWTKLGVLPEEQPGPNLRKGFYTMLEAYREGLNPGKQGLHIFNVLKRFFVWPVRPAYRFALTMTILLFGFIAGYFFTSSPNPQYQTFTEVTQLRNQVQQMRQQLAISMLNQQSPSQRLKGITWSSTVENPDKQILETLLRTLNYDPNVNVRLSAVDALYLFSHHPMIKKGLIDSLSNQTSPSVQMALIDLIVEMREKRAANALRQLIQKNKLNPKVKERAKLCIEQLI